MQSPVLPSLIREMFCCCCYSIGLKLPEYELGYLLTLLYKVSFIVFTTVLFYINIYKISTNHPKAFFMSYCPLQTFTTVALELSEENNN